MANWDWHGMTFVNITFGDSVRLWRMHNKMSQQEFAKIAGVSRNYISLIERDAAANLSLGVMIRVVDAMGLQLEISIKAKKGEETNA